MQDSDKIRVIILVKQQQRIDKSVAVLQRWEALLLRLEKRRESLEYCDIADHPAPLNNPYRFTYNDLGGAITSYYILVSIQVFSHLTIHQLRNFRSDEDYIHRFVFAAKRDLYRIILPTTQYYRFVNHVRDDLQNSIDFPSFYGPTILSHYKALKRALICVSSAVLNVGSPGLAGIVARRSHSRRQ